MIGLRIVWSPLWLPGIALAAAVVLFAAEAPSPARWVNAGLSVVGVLLTWAVALAVRARDPRRPMATLLFALAALLAIHPALGASSNPYLFTLARAARMASELMLVWVMLAFPSGRLSARVDRWLLVSMAAGVLLLWLPINLFTTQFPIGGPVLACEGECPRNVLFVGDLPNVAQALAIAFRTVAALLLLGAALRLLQRLWLASALMRRMLAPVLLVFVLRMLSLTLVVVTVRFPWLPVLLTAAVPAAIAWGLLAGRLWIARALQGMVSGLRSTPSRETLQPLMARALGDATLQVGYWLPDTSRWVDGNGHELRLPQASDARRATQMITGPRGEAAAVLIHDAALLEEPALVESVSASMRVALANHQLEAVLQSTRREAAQAAASERERLERDLHDGAQQRLLALRMKLTVVQRLIDSDPARAAQLLAETGPDIDAAVQELREFAHGIVPGLLLQEGLAPALVQLAERQPRHVTLNIEPIARLNPAVEQAVYFCCAEALQNAAKHSGERARIELTLAVRGQELLFSVSDDGPGIGATSTAVGRGLDNMRKRIADVGGSVVIGDRPSGGVMVEGRLMLTASMR